MNNKARVFIEASAKAYVAAFKKASKAANRFGMEYRIYDAIRRMDLAHQWDERFRRMVYFAWLERLLNQKRASRKGGVSD